MVLYATKLTYSSVGKSKSCASRKNREHFAIRIGEHFLCDESTRLYSPPPYCRPRERGVHSEILHFALLPSASNALARQMCRRRGGGGGGGRAQARTFYPTLCRVTSAPNSQLSPRKLHQELSQAATLASNCGMRSRRYLAPK